MAAILKPGGKFNHLDSKLMYYCLLPKCTKGIKPHVKIYNISDVINMHALMTSITFMQSTGYKMATCIGLIRSTTWFTL